MRGSRREGGAGCGTDATGTDLGGTDTGGMVACMKEDDIAVTTAVSACAGSCEGGAASGASDEAASAAAGASDEAAAERAVGTSGWRVLNGAGESNQDRSSVRSRRSDSRSSPDALTLAGTGAWVDSPASLADSMANGIVDAGVVMRSEEVMAAAGAEDVTADTVASGPGVPAASVGIGSV